MDFILSVWLKFFLLFFAQLNGSLENAFLQNEAQQLVALLPSSAPVMISLPEPLSSSDCYSPDQARAVVGKIFNEARTQEFFIDQPNPLVCNERGAIISARWSFVSENNSKKYVFRLYFFIALEAPQGTGKTRILIKEIRAERL